MIKNFSGKESLKDSVCMYLVHEKTGTKFMIPATGTIRKALENSNIIHPKKDANGGDIKDESYIGATFYFKRLPDGKSSQYVNSEGEGNKMFMFDVSVVKA